MPRVQKRPEMPIIRRKCYSCSKMATKPYVYQTVPRTPDGAMPVYQPRQEHTNRSEVKGVTTSYYCDVECFENR